MLGYNLAFDEQGKGYMTEAVAGAVAFAFGTWRLHRVSANYMPRNTKSGAVLERCGFRVEGHATRVPADQRQVGGPRPHRDHEPRLQAARDLAVPPPGDVAVGVLRWLVYLAVIYVIGALVVRRLAAHAPRVDWARPRWGGRVAAPLVLFAVAALAFTGHAAKVGAGAMFADALHVLSAGAWAGGIMALATLRPPAGWNGEEGRALLSRFGRVAVIAFAVTAMTGVLNATSQLRDLSDLWTTPYGSVLSLKSAGVLVMLVMSALTWRRGVGPVRLEAAIAVFVISATAVLAAYPVTR